MLAGNFFLLKMKIQMLRSQWNRRSWLFRRKKSYFKNGFEIGDVQISIERSLAVAGCVAGAGRAHADGHA